jgi:hypothetical protein
MLTQGADLNEKPRIGSGGFSRLGAVNCWKVGRGARSGRGIYFAGRNFLLRQFICSIVIIGQAVNLRVYERVIYNSKFTIKQNII